jgi:hypothetical protein
VHPKWRRDPCHSDGLVLTDNGTAELVELLDANEWQGGQCGSSKQFRKLVSVDRGHLRAMRLLPFAAAASLPSAAA